MDKVTAGHYAYDGAAGIDQAVGGLPNAREVDELGCMLLRMASLAAAGLTSTAGRGRNTGAAASSLSREPSKGPGFLLTLKTSRH
jgi:hypothetical protein